MSDHSAIELNDFKLRLKALELNGCKFGPPPIGKQYTEWSEMTEQQQVALTELAADFNKKARANGCDIRLNWGGAPNSDSDSDSEEDDE